MKILKYSHQREPIEVYLMSCHGHPTVDTLYASIRREFPNVSLGMVYRDLGLLAETSEIQELAYGGGAVHFNEDTRQHYHFVCSKCNQVYDIELGAMEDLDKEVQEYVSGIIDSHYVLFYGRYNSCLQKKASKAIDKPT